MSTEEERLANERSPRALQRSGAVVDGHNDLPWRLRSEYGASFENFDLAQRHEEGHTDIPRLREGRVGGTFFAAYVPPEYEHRGALRLALEQIDLIYRMVAEYPSDLALARTANDVSRIVESGKIAALIGVEGGHTIENSLAAVRVFARLGVRYLTLTHASTTDWADAATDEPRHGGLSVFGEGVIREMNRLGMLADISHVSFETMVDVLRVSQAPIIASHSGARAVNDHSRNVPDDVLRQIPANGGVVMVNFYSGFVVPEAADVVRDMFDLERQLRDEFGDDDEALEAAWREWWEDHPIPRGTVAHVVDHIDHIVQVAGIDHVGLGSDFDGITAVPDGLEDVSKYPAIAEELARRGYDKEQIPKILGGNILRVLADAEVAAQRLASASG
ncbi:MAG: dipeptidase [Gemmatimonadales bacterium]|jgi:membrane dipeptidase